MFFFPSWAKGRKEHTLRGSFSKLILNGNVAKVLILCYENLDIVLLIFESFLHKKKKGHTLFLVMWIAVYCKICIQRAFIGKWLVPTLAFQVPLKWEGCTTCSGKMVGIPNAYVAWSCKLSCRLSYLWHMQVVLPTKKPRLPWKENKSREH